MEAKARDKDDERKKAAAAASLVPGGGGSAGSGLGVGAAAGAGLPSGLGGAAMAGGLLATKAGLIGLVLIGSTVAGGLGLLGYRLSSSSGSESVVVAPGKLFVPKPEEPERPQTTPPSGSDSQSLSMFVAGNAGRGVGVTARKADAAAAAASAFKFVKSGNNGGNNADVTGNRAAELASAPKPEAAAAAQAAGAAAAAGGSPSAPANPTTALASLGKSLPGATGSLQPMASLGGQRAVAGRKIGASSAYRALGQVGRDQRAAQSSQHAGTTYDGGRPTTLANAAVAAAAAAAGGSDNVATMPGGAGAQSGAASPPPPEAKSKNVTPWQSAINTAMMCVLGAAACLMIASKLQFNPLMKPMVLVLAGMAAMLSTVTIAMGSMMMSGKYGQKFQGEMFTLSGGLMLAAAAAAAAGGDAAGKGSSAAPGAGGGKSVSADEAEQTGSPNLWMIAAGGASLAAAMAGFLSERRVVPDKQFHEGPPDWDGSRGRTEYRAPSEDALARFLV